MAYYKDLREHLKELEKRGKLVRIKREINKDTEMFPLARLQFRGLPEEERKAFMFEKVTDAKGRKYDIPVVTCVTAASRETYAIGLMCKTEEIAEKLAQAQLHPIKPKLVKTGPVHEEVHIGDTLLEHGGLAEFPIPISTPGFDVAPYVTSPCWVTIDPQTGSHNIGTYRAQIKSPTRMGILYHGRGQQDGLIHWKKWRELGKTQPAALVIGGPPSIQYVSVAKFPYEVDEFDVAGGIAGEPVAVVKCKTNDLIVPATAEVVFEGEVSITELEPEAPFGEAGGYMGIRVMTRFFETKCITHRKKPIWHTFLSQRTPSESAVIKRMAADGIILKQLKYDLNLTDVVSVTVLDYGPRWVIVRMKKGASRAQIWKALETAGGYGMPVKVAVAVDEDIYPEDHDSLLWAIATRHQPHRDTKIVKVRALLQDHSAIDPAELQKRDFTMPPNIEASCLLIDATLKWPYPPVSLPKKEFMEKALQLWKEEGLPPLRLSPLWYGYNLGFWSDEEEEQAQLALKGEHYQTGEVMRQRRIKI